LTISIVTTLIVYRRRRRKRSERRTFLATAIACRLTKQPNFRSLQLDCMMLNCLLSWDGSLGCWGMQTTCATRITTRHQTFHTTSSTWSPWRRFDRWLQSCCSYVNSSLIDSKQLLCCYCFFFSQIL